MALSIFEGMLADANVTVVYDAAVAAVATGSGGRILSTLTTGGRNVSGAVWIDASYEGDLLARAGVSFRVGREARTEHNESLAGVTGGLRGNNFGVVVDPFESDGKTPLSHTRAASGLGEVGAADQEVQAYNFRL